jgi:hypothetical protein
MKGLSGVDPDTHLHRVGLLLLLLLVVVVVVIRARSQGYGLHCSH